MRSGRREADRSLVHVLVLSALALSLLAPMGVAAEPIAEAGPDIQDHTGRPVVFEGFGTPDATQRIILYEWDFDGDGVYDWNSTHTGMCTHKYWEKGDFNATLRVTQFNSSDQRLLVDTDTTRVRIISGQPVGHIRSTSSAQVEEPYRFESDFYDPDGGLLEYEWSIEGALVSTDKSFKHTFDELGKYNVTLWVTDDEGESTHETIFIDVREHVETQRDMDDLYVIIGVVLAFFVIAVLAYAGILRGHRQGAAERPEEAGPREAPIVTEASLTDRQPEPTPRKKPKVVRPERVVVSPEKAKDKGLAVAAAPDRLPCPECGTILVEEGTCAFCASNEAIDEVEKHIRGLQEDGYILAKADEELETAKAELHVKNFTKVESSLANARALLDEAVREHERCLTLLTLVEELIGEARDRDLDVSKATNLLKLSRSFMKSGKYPKAIYYAERSRDFLLDTLEPFDLDRYFCDHCRGEVEEADNLCPHCAKEIESGLIKRARRELAELKHRFDGIARDHEQHTPIAAQLEKADEHVASRSASAAREHIQMARDMLDAVEGPDEGEGGPDDAPSEEGPGEEEDHEEDEAEGPGPEKGE